MADEGRAKPWTWRSAGKSGRTVFRCKACGLDTTSRMPMGGDGTARFPRRHRGDGALTRVGMPSLCSGVVEESDWVEVELSVRVFGDPSWA